MASQGQSKATSKKKNCYNGIPKRTCICGRQQCYMYWKFWCDFVDDGQGNQVRRKPAFAGEHVRVPFYSPDANTDLRKRGNFLRKVYFAHIWSKGHGGTGVDGVSAKTAAETRPPPGKKPSYQFIALHHFPESFLQPDGSGLKTRTVSRQDADTLGLTKSDRINLHGNELNGQYVLPPTRPFNDLTTEYLQRGGKLVPVQGGSAAPKAPPRSVPAQVALSGRPLVQIRKDTDQRELDRLTNQIKKAPEAFAIEYQKLEQKLRNLKKELDEAKEDRAAFQKKYEENVKELEKQRERTKELETLLADGLSRRNLISSGWHKKHPKASAHLLGTSFNWDQFVQFWTRAAFKDMIADGGGPGPITEFEKLMMTLLRANSGFEYETIGCIYGIDRRRVGEHVMEFEERLAKVGKWLSTLDMDFNHDYISLETAKDKDLPHTKRS